MIHHFSSVASSTSIDLCERYKLIMIAIATAASAAAIVMMKMVKNIPSSFSGYRYLLKATKLILTLFRMSSILISMVIMFLLVKSPYMPMKKSAVLTNNICDSGIDAMLYLLNDFRFGNNCYRSASRMNFSFSNRCFSSFLFG